MTIRRPLRAVLASATLPLLVAGLTACSSGGDGGQPAEDSLQKQARTWDSTLASCMRDAGFDFPDAEDGGTSFDGGADDAWFDQFDTCLTSTTDELGERPVTEAEKKDGEEAQKEFAKVEECLEENGIELPSGDGPIAQAPEVPDDIAAECGWDGLVPTTGE